MTSHKLSQNSIKEYVPPEGASGALSRCQLDREEEGVR